jgi:hypothetical protein
MKQQALKKRQSLALVTIVETAPLQEQSRSLLPVRSFRGWLSPVPKSADGPTLRPLTTEDFVQVELATIRESRVHAFWPTEVIARFLDAEVDKEI